MEAKKLEVVNYLRGYSITTIVLMHLIQSYDIPGWAMMAAAFGGAGVHVFILCSGFGLYLSYLRKPLSYKAFLKKRFGRVYWPMAVVCLVTALWMIGQGKDVLMPLLGNLLLFKMFVPELDCSMGGQMWFISTIIQFYMAWPLVVRLTNTNRGWVIALVISLLWSLAVGMSGHAEERVWNGFFLQYLWEFCLGMKLAEVYAKTPSALDVPKWKYLFAACLVGMILTGVMGYGGFPWTLFNDIPSLVGYLSLALLFYKLNIRRFNRFFSFTNVFSYEWYLVHILVFEIVKSVMGGSVSPITEFALCLILSYFAAWGFEVSWTYMKQRKRSFAER